MKRILKWLNRPSFVTGLFIALSSIILTVTILNYNKRKSEIIHNINTELKTIAELKASEVSTWINEKVNDSKVLTQGYFLSNRLNDYLQYKKKADYLNIYEKANTVKKYYNYEDVFILDTNKKIIVTTNQDIKEFRLETHNVIDELKQNEINFKVYKCNNCKKIHLDFLSPIYNSTNSLIGYALLRANPHDYLFPLISRWPTQSNTAETIIVRREGDSVLFINDVRHHNDAALKIKIPLTRTDVVAVKVVLGATDLIEGRDYRNIEVLAFALPIKNSNWAMIAKIDQEEVYSPIKRLYLTYGIILSLLFLFLATVVFLIRNTYQKSYIKQLYDKELEKKAIVSHYKYLIKNANDIILLANRNGDILEANDSAIKAYQIPIDKLRDIHLNNLGYFKLFTEKKSNGVYETIHNRLDGTKFPVEINEQYITIEGEIFYQAIIRDITEQNKAKERLELSEKTLQLFVKYAPASIAMFNKNMEYLAISDRFLIDYKLSNIDIIGKSHYDVFPDLPESWKKIHQKCLQGHIEYKEQDMFPRANGVVDWVRWEIHPWYDNADKVGGIFLFSEVITAKVEAKNALEKSETKFRSLFHSMSQGVVYQDAAGKIIDANPAAERLLGLSFSQLQGRESIDPRWHAIHEDGTGFPGNQHPAMVALSTGKSIRNVTMGIFNPLKNSYVWILVSAEPEFLPNESKPYQVFTTFTDITELKLANERLNTSEELHRLLFDYNPIPMWVYDAETLKFLKVNDTACEKYGYTREEFLSMTIRDIRPKDEVAKLEMNVKTSNNKLIQQSSGWRHVLKNGEIIFVDIHSHAFDYEGKQARMVAINDVTEKQKAKDELEKSQQFLSSIIENSGSLIYVKDINGKYLMVNKRWTEYTGYKASEVIGKTPSELFEPHNANIFIENDRKILISGQLQEVNEELDTRTGTKYFISIQFPLKDAEGNITGLCGMSTDVTKHKLAENEIKRSEEKYKSLIESSDAAITMMDFNGRYTYLNEIATRPFGKTSQEMTGLRAQEIFPPDQVEQIMKDIDNIKTLNRGYVKEVFVDLAGKPSWFRTSMQPVRDESGKPYAVLTYSTNITESKFAEEKIRESEEKLNYAQEIANIGSWDFNLRTRTGNWSKNLYKLLEVDPTLPPLTIYDFYNMVHPEDKERYTQMISLTENGENFDPISIRIALPSGKMKWIQINAVPKFKDGELIELSGVNIDITKSKEFEEEITTQNEKLKAFINAVPDKIFVHDEFGNFLEAYTSKEAFIAPIDQILGKNLKDLFGEDIGNLNIDKIKECLLKKDLVTHEFAANINGNPIYFEVRVVPFMNNKAIRFVRDITEKKIIEEEIIKSEERFRSTLDSMIEGCQIIDHNWNYLYINLAAEKQNRRPISELIGKNYVEMWPGIEHTRVYKQMKRCMTEKVSYSFDNEFTFPNGDSGWFRIGIQPIPEGIFILSVDITEKKQAELVIAKVKERLDLATESADIAIWDWDIVKNELVWDNRMFKLYGLEKGEQSKAYETWLSGIHPDDRDRCDLETQQALNNEKKYDTEFRVIWSNGSVHWLKANGQVFRDKNGNPVRMVGVNYDITKIKESENEILSLNASLEIKIRERTAELVEINATLVAEIEERKSIEEALKLAREEANKANIAKSEFLSRMSHELRTPLNSILGFAQLLEMGELNPNQQKGVTHIMKSGKHLLDLINEVLDISRIEAGRLSLSPEPVQIQSIIYETMDIVKPIAIEKKISLELNSTPICDLYIKADRQRIKQILINLINNAIKYNNEGGFVKVDCTQLFDESTSAQLIRISVIDNGFGISDENISNLFKPFERVGAEKTTIEGTGLGLAVAKKLVEAMGGKLGVESKLNEGSTFWIEIPQCESLFEITAKAERLGLEDSVNSSKRGTILYVEDNVPNVELVEQILETKYKSVELITTRLGKEAISLAEVHKPNLILLDLNLPDTHGSEVFEELKNNSKTAHIPVVVISADAMPQQLEKLLKAGVKQYLTKPLIVSEFLKVVNNYIDLK